MTLRYPDADGTVRDLLQHVNREDQLSHPIPPPGLASSNGSSVQSSVSLPASPLLSEPTKRSRPAPLPDGYHSNDDSLKSKRQRTVPEAGDREQKETSRGFSQGAESLPKDPDWRGLICRLVEADDDIDNANLEQSVRGVARILRKLADSNKPLPPSKPPEPIYKVLHRVVCQYHDSLDIDPPFGNYGHLRSANRVENLELYLERNQDASFIVFREYTCCTGVLKEAIMGVPGPYSEKLMILSESLLRTLIQLKNTSPNWKMLYPEFQLSVEIERPHLWTYLGMEDLEGMMQTLQQKEDITHLELFLRYFRDEKKAHHDQLRELLSQNMITTNFIEYLFVPGELILENNRRRPEFDQVKKQVSWPGMKYEWHTKDPHQVAPGLNFEKKQELECKITVKFKTSQWDYDGNFQEKEMDIALTCIYEMDSRFPISDLPSYPLRYAKAGVQTALEVRGNRFWQCRKRRYVEYSGVDCDMILHQPKTRFMVDATTYKQTPFRNQEKSNLKDGLGPTKLASDEPPGGDFVLLLPATLVGFHMQDKKWKKLLVCHICDVVWDQDAFNTLVLPTDTKDLIMALVTNKIDASQSTEFFQGKGTGLVILFHGAPGTGKTLTAESVAEYAKKPLYRVTCGDIGTKPEDVERYLKYVLWLGKTWGCVVLLDEAEVFLQERALNDIQRNALVSVFLRVLEYYDGILVLTSNRVGIFDEGFKSRIQLAIHYEKLTQSSRERVWENFISRLESFNSNDIDTRDLRRHLKELADFEMNGRQIRNAVTTGRQLAMFQKKALDFDCMRHVINIARRFDKYLTGINEGMDDEDLAREDRLR